MTWPEAAAVFVGCILSLKLGMWLSAPKRSGYSRMGQVARAKRRKGQA